MKKQAFKKMKRFLAFALAVIMVLQIPLTHVPLQVHADGDDTTTVSGKVLWQGDSEDARPDSVEVKLLQNGTVYQTVKTDAEKNWEYSFTDIPKAAEEDGTEYGYTVEAESLDDYISDADGTHNGLSIAFSDETYSVSADYGSLSIYYESEGTMRLLGTWSAKELAGAVIDVPSKEFYLYWDGNHNLLNCYGFSIDYIIGKEVAASADDKEDELPDAEIITVSGTDYPETTHPYASNESKLWKYEGFGGTGYNIVELYNRQDIAGTIEWVGDSQEKRPAEVIVELERDGESCSQTTTSSASNWEYSFEDVPKYNDNMKKYSYTTSISSMDDYSYTCDSGNIVCTYTKADIELDIHWDNSLTAEDKKEDFTFNMVKRVYECDENGSYTGEYTDTVVSSVTTNAAMNWKAVFENITRCDENGEDYTYLITLDGNEKYSLSGQNITFPDEGNDFTIPVTIIPAGKAITGLKSWRGDQESDRPEEIELILYQNGTEYARTTTSAEKNWEYSFGVVPEKDANGNKQEYYIKEVPVEGYTALYYAEGDGVELTFSEEMRSMDHTSFGVYYKSGEEYICVKSFDTLSEAAGVTVTVPSTEFYISAESIIEIPFSYKLISSADDDNIGTVDLSAASVINGAEIKKLNGADGTYYPVNAVDGEETAVHGYTVTTSSNEPASGLLQLANSITVIDIPVSITWDGVDESERPESITVQLTDEYDNDYGQVVLSQDNSWAAVFESVRDRGSVYKLKDITIEGLEAELSGNIYDGYVYKVKKSATSGTETDNWELGLVFYDSTVDNGTTPLTAINWDASDGGYGNGSSRVITVQINYKNTNAVTTYEAGELKIKIPNLIYGTIWDKNISINTNKLFGNYEAKWNATAIVGANDSSHTEYNWDFISANAPTNEQEFYEFSNAIAFEENTNFEGTIQIIYTITPYKETENGWYLHKYLDAIEKFEDECTHNYSMDLQAELYDSEDNQLDISEVLPFSYTRTYIHPWVKPEVKASKEAYKISSYDRLGENPEDYTWVKYTLRGDDITSDYPEIGMDAKKAIFYDLFPSSCKVVLPSGEIAEPVEGSVELPTGDVLSSNEDEKLYAFFNETKTINGNCVYETIFVGYPKDTFNVENNNMVFTNTVYYYGKYENETEIKYLNEASVTVNLNEFAFSYTGELYGITKSERSDSRDMRYQDILKEWGFCYSDFSMSFTARYTGTPMTIKFGDDLLYATNADGNYSKLNDDEYYFGSIMGGTIYNGNNIHISKDVDAQLWIRYQGEAEYILYREGTYYDIFNNPNLTSKLEQKVVGYYFLIQELNESCFVELNNNCTVYFMKKDILTKGELHNFAYLQVFFKDENGNLVLQNEPTRETYANGITQEIADYDLETYGTYVQRATAYNIWEYYNVPDLKTRPLIRKTATDVTQNVNKQKFTGSYYLSFRADNDVLERYIEDYKLEDTIKGFILYDLLPEGMELTSSPKEIIESLGCGYFESSYSDGSRDHYDFEENYEKSYGTYSALKLDGTDITQDELKNCALNNTKVTIIENWNNTNRTYVKIETDLSELEILNLSSSYDRLGLYFKLNYSISYDSFLEYGNTYKNELYGDFYNPNEYQTNQYGSVDNIDIDEDGNITETLSYTTRQITITNVVSSLQDVQTTVQTDKSNYSTGTVKASPETEYSYKLRARSGVNPVTNLVLINNLEEAYGSNDYWKGEFLGIDTTFAESRVYKVYDPSNTNADDSGYVDETLSVKVYYSGNTDEGNLYQTELRTVTDDEGNIVYNSDGTELQMDVRVTDSEGNFVKNTNWLAYSDSVDKSKVKSLAFEFLNAETGEPAVLPANDLAYVEVLMKAPAESEAFDGTTLKYAYNNCFTQWNAIDEFDQTVDFITGINSNTVKVNLVDKTTISGTKTWVDDTETDRPKSITVNLLQNGEVYKTTTTSAADNWVYSFDEVPIINETDDSVYTYSVSEDEVIGYTTSYKKTVDGTDVSATEPTAGYYDIVNTAKPKVTISGKKTWIGDTEADRPEFITVNLLLNGSKVMSTKTDATKNWEYSFGAFPKFDPEGNEYKYSVSEDAVSNYETSYSKVAINPKWYEYYYSTQDLYGTTVTVPSKEFYVLAVAMDDAVPSFDYILKNTEDVDFSTLKEKDIETLLDDAKIKESMDELKTEVSLTASASEYSNAAPMPYEKSLTVLGEEYNYGLYHYVVDASEGEYSGVELVFDEKMTKAAYTRKFIILIPSNEDFAYNITNTFETVEINGTKTWVGDTPADRPESITVNLLQNGTKIASTTTDSSKEWKYSFNNIPECDRDGNKYVYTVEEEPLARYTTSYSKVSVEGLNGLAITFNENCYTPDSGDYFYIYYYVEGVLYSSPMYYMSSAAGKTIKIPSTDFYIYWSADRDGKSSYGFSIDSIEYAAVNENFDNDWSQLPSVAITELEGNEYPETDHNPYAGGEEILWHYQAGYSEPTEDAQHIVNTLKTKSIHGRKIWDNDVNSEVLSFLVPESITINLLQNGNLYDSVEIVDLGCSETWDDETEEWISVDYYSFYNVPVCDSEGNEYVYTVEEVPVDDWIATYDGYDISNTYNRRILLGYKEWIGDTVENRPDSIIMKLFQNGVLYDSMEVTKDSEWKDAFIYDYDEEEFVHLYGGFDRVSFYASVNDYWEYYFDVPIYDENGNEYEYTVEEVSVEGYKSVTEKVIMEDEWSDGFDFVTTNTYLFKNISGMKTWDGGNEEDRPDSITLNILQNGVVYDSIEVTSGDDWKYSINVPKFDSEGNEYEYTVEEIPVEGYDSTYKYIEGTYTNGVSVTFGEDVYIVEEVYDETRDEWVKVQHSLVEEEYLEDYLDEDHEVTIFYILDDVNYILDSGYVKDFIGKTIDIPSKDFYFSWECYGWSVPSHLKIESIVYKDVIQEDDEDVIVDSYSYYNDFCDDVFHYQYNSEGINLVKSFEGELDEGAGPRYVEYYRDEENIKCDIVNKDNTKTTVPLEFIKTDFLTGEAISDVEFNLFKLICTNTDVAHDHGKAGSTGCWENITTATSDASGNVSFEGLEGGNSYGLVETCPSDYILPISLYWNITVSVDGEIAWETVGEVTELNSFIKDYAWCGYSLDVEEDEGVYTLDNIKALREIKATKLIKADEINFANGTPIFIFKLTGTDEAGNERTYYKSVSFTEDYVAENTNANGYVSLSAAFDKLLAGNYVLSEEDVSRYEFESISKVTNGTVVGKTVEFDMITNTSGKATYKNKVYEKQWFSHNNIVINEVGSETSITPTGLSRVLLSGSEFNATIPVNATKVAFTDEVAPAAYSFEDGTLIDVSEAQDGGVVAWYDSAATTYYVSTQRYVTALSNPDSSYMFSSKSKLKDFDFKNLNTELAEDMSYMFYRTNNMTSVDVSKFDTSKVTTMEYMFGSDAEMKLTSIKFGDNFDTSKVKSFLGMFRNLRSITAIDVTGFDTSSATIMERMFDQCQKLQSVDVSGFDVSNVTTMKAMFQQGKVLTTVGDLSGWDTLNVTNFEYTFYGCNKLKSVDVSKWDTNNVTTMKSMFTNCYAITELDVSKWDTSSCTDMSFMLYKMTGLTSIDFSNWDVSKVTTFDHFMAHSTNLASYDVSKWNVTSACTQLAAVFHSTNVTSIDVTGWDVRNVIAFDQTFEAMSYLTEIKGLETWNTSSGISFAQMFSGCSNLKELNLSGFDTRRAVAAPIQTSQNGSEATCTWKMFDGLTRLEKLSLGENFILSGDGTSDADWIGTFPTPSSGYWYAESDGTAYLPSEVPNLKADTYYSTK